MLSIVVILVLVVLAVFAIKLNHLRHRIFIIILVLIVLFFYVTFFIVKTNHGLDFSNTSGIISAIKIYTGWLANSFNNFLAITGNAIKMDWKNTNATVFDKKNKDVILESKEVVETEIDDLSERFPGYVSNIRNHTLQKQ